MTDKLPTMPCWQLERMGVVINRQALSVDRANFLATHVPMRRIVYDGQAGETSENGFLKELNHYAATDQHLFAVVKGIPGTGKSHLIRWLKEQYALAHPDDSVLLITRDNTSLRGTIEQIIQAGIFETLPDSLKRLQGAIDVLSADTLAEQILNSLEIATSQLETEVVEKQIGALHSRLSAEKIKAFLLDIQVRQMLSEPGGPIERITTYLTAGIESNQGTDRILFFEAQDFTFKPDWVRQVQRGAYPKVYNLCEDLRVKGEIRESLASYLNYALHHFAIGDATKLAAGDLRTMFSDLRRHLRQMGKSLALFIEDITAVTGIEQGLIEVLIAPHTGENSSYCRLLSVVGITDTWYRDFLPDNVKERTTHRLTLNASSGREESDFLRDENVLAEFAAHYLNAMRVSQSELESWANRGPHLDAMPNGCEGCAFRQACHRAFGAVEFRDESNGAVLQRVGLFPFNRRALATLYANLREGPGVSYTPRTFLFSVLGYILQHHTEKITMGEFPPPPRELAYDVNVPSFNPQAHERLIDEQGGINAARLKTLFLFWGNQSVYRQEGDGALPTIGEIPIDLLHAFRLPPIAGVKGQTRPAIPNEETPVEAPAKPSNPSALNGKLAVEIAVPETLVAEAAVATQKPAQTTTLPPATSAVAAPSKYSEMITGWANGERLYGNDRFAGWIAEFVRNFVDWQSYGISTTQVKEYIAGGRLFIEGQNSNANPARLYLKFSRNDKELRYVLQALADLNDPDYAVTPEQYGEHIATLGGWLRLQEPRFVAFAREPSGIQVNEEYLTAILLQNCTWLAILAGELGAHAANTHAELYQQVIASCAASTEKRWGETMANLEGFMPKEWLALMRQVDSSGAVHRCRTELLNLLNRPQGGSSKLTFLDAATALHILGEFQGHSWQPRPLTIKPTSNDPLWQSAIAMHEVLEKKNETLWRATHQQLATDFAALQKYLADATPTATFKAVQTTLNALRSVKEYATGLDAPFQPPTNARLNADHLEQLLVSLAHHLEQSEDCVKIAGLSAHYSAWHHEATRYINYFNLLAAEVEKQSKQFGAEITKLRSVSDAEQKYREAQNRYDEIMSNLEFAVPREEAA